MGLSGRERKKRPLKIYVSFFIIKGVLFNNIKIQELKNAHVFGYITFVTHNS